MTPSLSGNCSGIECKHHRFERCWYWTILIASYCIRKIHVSHRSNCKNMWKKTHTKVTMRIIVVSITFPHSDSSLELYAVVYRPLPIWSVRSKQLPFLPHGLTILLPQRNSKTGRKCSLLSDSEATMNSLPENQENCRWFQPLLGHSLVPASRL